MHSQRYFGYQGYFDYQALQLLDCYFDRWPHLDEDFLLFDRLLLAFVAKEPHFYPPLPAEPR